MARFRNHPDVSVPLRLESIAFGLRRPGLHRRASGAAALVSLVAAALLSGIHSAWVIPGMLFTAPPGTSLGGLCLFLGLSASFIHLLSRAAEAPSEARHRADLEMREGVIRISGEEQDGLEIAVADVEAGWVDSRGRAVLRLADGRELTVAARRPADIEALLQAAGVAPDQRTARMPIGSVLAALRGGSALGSAGLVCAVPPLLLAAAALGLSLHDAWLGLLRGSDLLSPALSFGLHLLLLLGVLGLLAPRRAVVGTDGVAIEGLLRRRFIAYADLAEVTAEPRGVRLRPRRARGVLLPRAPGGEALHDRILAAMGAEGPGAEAYLDFLERRGRPLDAWAADLRGRAGGAPGYRAGAIAAEQLAAVAEQPAASPERRVAAAVSAAASGYVAARRRIRSAARACADVELRAALEQAAEAEAAEEALARVTRARCGEQG